MTYYYEIVRSKSGLKGAMVVFLSVVNVMVHRSAVYAPVADGTIPHIGRQLARDLHAEGQHHLKPKIIPAKIAYYCMVIELDVLRS